MNDSNRPDKQYSNFVPALREPAPRMIEVESFRDLPAPPQTVLLPTANYTDRARGFTLAASPLAATTGLVVVLIGVSAFGIPLMSVTALLLALAGFAVVWLCAYVIHAFVSPDGATFMHVVLMWAHLRREQSERIKRYGIKDK